ncbi:MAG: PKD domain-containing protein, partial [Crocinitomicaceae bacterium]|nr:PKD domain-containing protein [Crocinitomicaceae bacterium]
MKLKSILTLFAVIFVGSVIHAQISFSPSTTSGCVNDQITFTNTSTAGVHYDWYMGDGNSYNDQPNVNHAYAQGGGYWVQMYAYDATWNYLGYYEEYIEISGPPQNINMPGAACPGDEISLSIYMIDAISWSWDLGDGTTQSGYDYIQHTYSSPGIYYPQVTITSLCGTFVVKDTITITNSLSNFNYYTNLWVDPDSVCPNSNVWGSTYGGFSGYAWDFGDGNTAFGNDYEQWTYSSVGTYTVSLTVTNGCGVDTVLTDQVVVSNTTPVQNPGINMPDTICPNENFWADAYASDGVSYVWNMGDGSPPIMDGSHEYAYSSPGIYTVTCLITNNCGNSTTVNHTIVVDPNAPVNNPYFDVSDHIVCPGDQVNFWSNWEYDFYIDFGDGNGSSESGYHSYSSPGTYVVSSTIQNACGNSITLYDTISVQNNIPVNPGDLYAYAWPSPACPGTEVELDATWGYQTYQWNFGDGSTGTGSEADHIYYAPGVYNVTVLITNGCGNSGTATTTVTIQNNLPITDVDWMVSADTICPGNSVFFQSDEDEGAFTHVWDFGDGNTSTAPIISYQYDNVGVYPVSLTITNGCGYDSTVYDTVVVSNNYSYGPGDLQVFAQNEGCLGDELYFVVIPSGAGDITWDFGDGNSTNQVQTVLAQGIAEVDVAFHAYAAIGTYWATYSITNACGNTYTDSIEITVGGPGSNMQLDPTFWWDQSTAACQGQPIEFMAVGGATYVWNFGDGTGNLVTNSSLTPVYHTYTDPGQYTVTVNTYNSCGNSDVTDENIVIPQSQMDITTNTVVQSNCGQNNGVAIATVSGGMAPYTYSWTNGDSGVIADSLSSGVYVITVTDNNDCSNEAIATVSDVEGVTILVDNVVDVNCYGAENGSISVSILGGQPPYNILWSNGDQTEDIYGLQAGPYEIFVTDANGCFAVQSIEVTQPAKSTVSVIAQPATCGSNNGSAVASVNNGTGPFNFIWPNTSGPSNTTGGLSPGVHTLLVIDGNTCLHEKTFAINETGAPIIVTDSTVVGTCNGTLSSVYISTIGGHQPLTYHWSTGPTTQHFPGALPGNYTV